MPYGGTTPEEDTKIESCVTQVMPTLKDKYPDEKERKSHAIAICKSKIMDSGKNFFFSDKIEIKSHLKDGIEKFYLTGVVSSSNKDLGYDIVSERALGQLVETLNTKPIKLGYDHQEILTGRPTMVPIGKSINGTSKLIENGTKAYAEFELNDSLSIFPEIKNSLERGFLDAFSVEYRTNEAIPAIEHKGTADSPRYISSWDVVGMAVTGRPMNPDAYAQFCAKHLEGFIINDIHIPDGIDVKKENKTGGIMEELKVETKDKVEVKSQPDFEKIGRDTYEKEIKSKQEAELKSVIVEQIKAEIKNLPRTEPYINPEQKFSDKPSDFSEELKNFRELVQKDKVDIEVKYNAAAKLHKKLHPYGITKRMAGSTEFKKAGKSFDITGNGLQNIELKHFEYKAQLEHDTNKVSDTDYYQNAAELNDIYDPVIISHLNDKHTLWGLMKKKDVSNIGSDRYGFRIWRTRIEGMGGDSSTYNYDENPTITGYHAKMLKCQIPFMQYGVSVEVSGLTEAETRGSIGDVFAQNIQRASADLLSGINVDLYGTSYGATDGGKILGLEVIGDDGGTYATLYGHARATYDTLQGTDDAQSSVNIDKPLLRKAIRTPEKNGANREDLIIVCDPIQRDKILGMLDPAQRFMSTSARAGFEGLPTFDAIPIHSDKDCPDGYIIVIDMRAYYAAILTAPTYEDLAKTTDSKKGFIKTYFAVVCENPNHIYKITGLLTT
jgi:hypothetical protein